ERRRVLDETRGGGNHPDALAGMVSRNPRMHEIFNTLAKLSRGDVPVLLVGEPGTGKDLCARALHNFGPRRRRPFAGVTAAPLAPTPPAGGRAGPAHGPPSIAALPAGIALPRGGTLLLDKIESADAGTQRGLLPLLERYGATRAGGVGKP